MNKAYLLKRTRRITLVYMVALIAMSIYIIVKLVGLYFSSEIISFKNLVFSDIDSSFFTKIIHSVNPSIEYYLDSNNPSNRDISYNNQVEILYGYNIPLVSYIMNKSDYSYYTASENYPRLNEKNRVIESEDDHYDYDESIFNSYTLEENSTPVIKPMNYTLEQLHNFNFVLSNFFIVDNTVPKGEVTQSKISMNDILTSDMSINSNQKGPKILIYHTHSQESFIDSVKGKKDDTVVGVGDELTRILEEDYGIEVLHHREEYDLINGKLDRSKAYELIEDPLKKILKENPSIEVLIDLHRDKAPDNTKLVRTINDKPTAMLMFFNGLAIYDDIMPNKYVKDNIAFSFQMQLKANELYPGLTRKIYLKKYRYNMHLKPKTLLIELGGHTNTVQEAKNAMDPLAEILYEVIK